jgi:histidinol phosphatase-like PHP family hydrolase
MKILHDLHIHTNLSSCANKEATLEGYLNHVQKIGLKKIGISNHFWDRNIEGATPWYQVQDFDHVAQIRPDLEKYSNSDVKIYFGCEAEYDYQHHGIGLTEETAEQFDYILVPNSHTHMMMPKSFYEPHQKHVDFLLNAYEEIIDSNVSRYITAIAHPFVALDCPYNPSILIDMITDDKFKELFDKTAKKGIAFEINVASMSKQTHSEIEQNSQIRMFRLAKECGCKFIFGSDAHYVGTHDTYLPTANFIAELLELKEENIADIARIY